ncbi:MAG: CHAT domain-containing protein [bacterium]
MHRCTPRPASLFVVARIVSAALLLGLAGCPKTPKAEDPRGLGELTGAAERASLAGRHGDAQRLWTKVFQRARQEGKLRLRDRAIVHLARAATAGGHRAVARAVLQQAIKGARESKDRRRLAILYAALGDVQRDFGHYSEAVDAYLWAKMYSKATRMHALRTRVLARLAHVAALRGHFEFALQAMAEVAMLIGELRGLAAAEAALEVGKAYARLADQKRARRYLGNAQMVFQARGKPGLSGETLVTLARLDALSGDRAGAARDFRLAIQQFADMGAHRRHAVAAWHFSRALAAWGQHHAAEAQRAAVRRSLRTLGDRYGEAQFDLDIGRTLARKRRFRDAVPALQRAVAVLEKQGDRFGSGEARVLLGRARVQLGQAAEAVGELTRALDHTAAVGAPELSWQAYAQLGFLTDTLLDREDKAARFHKGAVNALERVRAGLDLIGGADSAAEDNAYYELARVYIKQWRRGGEPAHFDAALASLERNRSRRFVDLLGRAGASLADSEKERVQVRALSGEERALSLRLAEPGTGLALRKHLYQRLTQIRSQRTKVESQAFRFAAAHPAAVSVGILKGALDEQAAVLIYHVGQRSSLLYAVNNEQSMVVNLPGQAEIAGAVARFTGALFGAGGSVADVRRYGAVLYQRLVAPVTKVLTGRTRVQLVLGGPLWRVPFAALPVGRTGWLSDGLTFLRIPSPAVWLKLKATPRGQDAKRELLVLSVPGGGDRRVTSPIRDALTALGHRLGALPGAAARSQAIARAMGGKRVEHWTARLAGETQLRKSELARYRRLHFAARLLLPGRTHGPVQPTLVLAGASGSSGDGLVLLREVLGLTLDADLVAVDSLDLGRDPPDWQGQEAMALTLLLTGARTVLLPLVQPDPEASTRFVWAFYSSLASSPDKAVALAAAQRAVRRSGSARHPRHFASFVLYGAW